MTVTAREKVGGGAIGLFIFTLGGQIRYTGHNLRRRIESER